MLQLKKFAEHHSVGMHKISDFQKEINYYNLEITKAQDLKKKYDEQLLDAERDKDDDKYVYYKFLSDQQIATIHYSKDMIKSCERMIARLSK